MSELELLKELEKYVKERIKQISEEMNNPNNNSVTNSALGNNHSRSMEELAEIKNKIKGVE